MLVFVLLCITVCFAIILKRKRERAGCFTLIVLKMPCDCKCSATLHHDAVGRSAVCGCGISWSYSPF